MDYKWEIIKDFQGKSHKQGGIDISISGGRIKLKSNNSEVKAANGMFIGAEDPPGGFINKVGQVDIVGKAPKGYFNKDSGGNIILTPDQLKNDFDFNKTGEGYYELLPKNKKYIEKAFGYKLPKDYVIGYVNFSEFNPEAYSTTATDFDFKNKYDEFILPDRDEFLSKYARSNEDWKDAYSRLNTDIKSLDSYRKKTVTGYILKQPNNLGVSHISNIDKNTLDPITDKLIEYKNSEAYIERLAGSYYSKDIDIDKWISEPWYREHYAKRYLNENGDDAKKIINEVRGINPEMRYEEEGLGSAYGGGRYFDVKNVSVNRVFHGGNYNTKEEWTAALTDFLKNKGVSEWIIPSAIESIQGSTENSTTNSVVSHEQYHNQFMKKNLLNPKDEKFKEKYDKIFPENNLIWELNKFTKNKPINEFKETLGYAKYNDSDPEKELTHEMSPEETKADIYSTRDYLRYKYDFEHIDSQFDDKMFEKLMNDEYWKKSLIGKRMIERFGEDKKTWKIIMNLIASADNPSSKSANMV